MALVRGYIYDEVGMPVENASIVFPDVPAFALSHDDGYYQANGISPGTQTVHVVQRYYRKKIMNIIVSGDTHADIVLER